MANPNEPIEHTATPPTVTVTVGEAGDELDELSGLGEEPGPEQAALTAAAALYSFGIDIEYEFDGGVAVAPKAGVKGTPLAVWRVHGGHWKMVVTWEATSINERPRMPHPEEMCPNEHLLSGRIVYGDPKPAISGGLIYRAAGRYEYALRYAPMETDQLAGATSPIYEGALPAALNTITISGFDRNLMSRLNPSGYAPTPGEEGLSATS